jgi:hypothetical protein
MMVLRADQKSAALSVAFGDIPEEVEEIGVHCLTHGHLSTSGREVRQAIAKYRREHGRRTVRLLARTPSAHSA